MWGKRKKENETAKASKIGESKIGESMVWESKVGESKAVESTVGRLGANGRTQ